MNRLTAFFCFLVLAAGVAAANETTETITKLNTELMSKEPGVLPGSGIVTSGQPDEVAFRNIAGAGYSTVIDMRAADEDRGLEEQRIVEALGMTYLLFPIADKEDISFAKAAELDEILTGLDGPVLVHCASGNRVGAMFALRAKNNGASSVDALAIGKAAGMTRLTKLIQERLDIK